MHDQMTTQTPYPNPAGGYAPAPAPKRRRTGILVAVSALIALIVVAGGLAVFGPFRASSTSAAAAGGTLAASRSGQSSTSVAGAGDGAPTTVDEIPTTVAPAPVPVANPTSPGGNPTSNPGNGGGTSGGGAPAPQPPAPPAPSAPAPVITSFVTPENIDCHNGDFQMFSASWTTTNATKTMISIDGPGGYKTYGPNDSDSLPFSCSSAHTFVLTAYGHDGSTVSRSITLQPRNVQAPPSADDEDQGAVPPASVPGDDI